MIKVPEMDIAFAISARAIKANENFLKMKEIIKEIVDSFGRTNIRYSVIIIGDVPHVGFSFRDVFPAVKDIKKRLDALTASSSGRSRTQTEITQ